MRKNTLFSMLIIAISFIFIGCSSEATPHAERTFIGDLTNKPLLLFVGEARDDAKHDLIKLSGGQKGDLYFNLEKKSNTAYEFVEKEGNWYFRMFENGNLVSTVLLYRDCDEQEKCTIFGKNPRRKEHIIGTFVEMPAGYEHIIKAENLAEEGGSQELITKNCKEAIEKANLENGNYSRFVKINAARLLLKETSEFLLARTLFKELGMEGKMAEAEIMFIAKGPAVAAEDIHGTAELAWKSIIEDKSYDTAMKYEHGEAIAYACAKVGEFEKAYYFAGKVLVSAQRNAAENKKKGVYFDINRMNNVSIGYGEKIVPEAFQASILTKK